jgi:hypothetical protein
VLLLPLAALGLVACDPPTAPQASTAQECQFISFDIPSDCDNHGPPPPPQVVLIVSVSPKTVRAGGQFTAFANVGFFCGGGRGGPISVTYANQTYPQFLGGAFASLTDTLTAVLGDTVVTFQASCTGAAATQSVTIQVLPAQ